MAEETTGVTPDTASARPAGTVDDDTGEQEDGETQLPEKFRRALERARAEARGAKAAAREAEALRLRLKEREDADLSETEKLRNRAKDLEARLDEQAALRQALLDDIAIRESAAEQGAQNPKIVARLLDRGAIERDAQGNPQNIDELVKTLLKNEPYLKAQPAPTQGVPGTPRSAGQPGHEDRVQANKEKLQATGLYGRL